VNAYSRLTEKGLVTTVRLVGTTSTEDEEEAAAELATATGGEGLRALFGPRLSLGEPSPPPMGGVLEAGGELAVVTVNSPV
jgi:hypothetical protein